MATSQLTTQIRYSIVVSISACHAEDLGSIPGRGVFFGSWLLDERKKQVACLFERDEKKEDLGFDSCCFVSSFDRVALINARSKAGWRRKNFTVALPRHAQENAFEKIDHLLVPGR